MSNNQESFNHRSATKQMIDMAVQEHQDSDYSNEEFEVEDEVVCLICLDLMF